MEFSHPKIAAKLFELCAQSLDVENMQRLADALDLSIPTVSALFIEAQDVATAQAKAGAGLK
jgi:hypothetical protein